MKRVKWWFIIHGMIIQLLFSFKKNRDPFSPFFRDLLYYLYGHTISKIFQEAYASEIRILIVPPLPRTFPIWVPTRFRNRKVDMKNYKRPDIIFYNTFNVCKPNSKRGDFILNAAITVAIYESFVLLIIVITIIIIIFIFHIHCEFLQFFSCVTTYFNEYLYLIRNMAYDN